MPRPSLPRRSRATKPSSVSAMICWWRFVTRDRETSRSVGTISASGGASPGRPSFRAHPFSFHDRIPRAAPSRPRPGDRAYAATAGVLALSFAGETAKANTVAKELERTHMSEADAVRRTSVPSTEHTENFTRVPSAEVHHEIGIAVWKQRLKLGFGFVPRRLGAASPSPGESTLGTDRRMPDS